MENGYSPSNEHFWLLIPSSFLYPLGIFTILGLTKAINELKKFNLATENMTILQIKQVYGNRKTWIIVSIAVHGLNLFMFLFYDNILYGSLLR